VRTGCERQNMQVQINRDLIKTIKTRANFALSLIISKAATTYITFKCCALQILAEFMALINKSCFAAMTFGEFFTGANISFFTY